MDFETARRRMVDRLAERGRIDRESTAEALRTVPRHAFVPPEHHESAYRDRPLPIGGGQTISAPHMVAIVTDLLSLDPGDRVLEIGTGCGYHAAVTAEALGQLPENDDERSEQGGVYSVEYDPNLADSARETLSEHGYNVRVRTGDGYEGWAEHAPYDRAYLTCAPDSLPVHVLEQLRPGGCLVGPVGRGRQTLVRAWRREDGGIDRETHGGVRFVPMRRGD
ncbi:protein-L-isoaspartate O-methyltransferase [Haloprofundus marisrubri]|uniref:Protein-L-isoaspartate O-methyltransferase n=1 Tax=Haloprofundus marisrubri TaxID=1514971 RepID=A0A0W1RCK9_9EURY|nr:protein-L-isoaspartate(D-aspartate) O-methyltransferase [Haloprofundus marisrubri]KTG10863.1 protein-L-isoaspartate O-methyltransferase [Haloprofundus marisrubri]